MFKPVVETCRKCFSIKLSRAQVLTRVLPIKSLQSLREYLKWLHTRPLFNSLAERSWWNRLGLWVFAVSWSKKISTPRLQRDRVKSIRDCDFPRRNANTIVDQCKPIRLVCSKYRTVFDLLRTESDTLWTWIFQKKKKPHRRNTGSTDPRKPTHYFM